MARGAPLATLDDETPLNGPDVDVAVRIGWVTRMARLCPGPTAVRTLDEMARRLDVSVARLHRFEIGALRDGRLVDGYEAALGRPPGSLRAPIDVACRTFPSRPVDRGATGEVSTVRALSRLTEQVVAGGAPGGTWLAWARALARPGAIGLPESWARSLADTLIGELSRSVGHAHPTRYEALSLLRCSEYGHVVLEAARDWVADPSVQVLYDLCSAVGEATTDDAVAWCLELLDDPRDRVLVGGVLALENMGHVSPGSGLWRDLADPVLVRYNGTEPGSTRWDWLSHLVRLIPREERTGARTKPRHALSPVAKVDNWSRTRLNVHWSDCQQRAHEVTLSLGLSDQPVLARLLFDIAISPYESGAVTSVMLLGGLPHLADPVARHVADLAENHPDPVVRSRAVRWLPGSLHGGWAPVLERWLAGDGDLRDGALFAAGAAGVHVDERTLTAALTDGPGSAKAAVYAAGMTGHPLLDRLATSRRHGADVPGAARWWQRQGTRVVDAEGR